MADVLVLNYGFGNNFSVLSALKRAGANPKICQDPEEILKAERFIFPGQGHFQNCMDFLHEKGLDQAIDQFINKGRPFLGICLGYQALFNRSEEGGLSSGLGIFEGEVVHFHNPPLEETPIENLKVPHMGWNQVDTKGKSHPVIKGIANSSYFYFVHSYFPVLNEENPPEWSATTHYGYDFASCASQDNVFACQFHPEKSQKAGTQLLQNFLEWKP